MNTNFFKSVFQVALFLLAAVAVVVIAVILVARQGQPATSSALQAPGAPPLAAQAPPVDIVITPNPRAQAGLRLGGVGSCQAWGSRYLIPPGDDIDARIIEAGGPGKWLEPRVWIGDAASAVKAFDAKWAAREGAASTELWVEAQLDGKLTEIGLVAFTSPAGHQTWHILTTGRLEPCPPGE